jgi:hypothetical protein
MSYKLELGLTPSRWNIKSTCDAIPEFQTLQTQKATWQSQLLSSIGNHLHSTGRKETGSLETEKEGNSEGKIMAKEP